MAEENDKTGRDEALNEDASTPETADDATDETPVAEAPAKAGKFDRLTQEEGGVRKLTGMYKNWFLDYASYVILERAVPHVEDGLKPVQRRILHAMKVVDDGRYNKVANLVGQTMQYHPHGDASIKDALVQLGQKDLLIDCQGNWGNILTGDEAAAGRYIEARLSKFALDVVFNKKTTEWMLSYDGRKEEPVTLPIKFPLLLAQGSDGIAVGLASKILPHNFVELINAAIAHLQGRDFQLYPDFPTGGMADVSRYNDGLRGGTVKVRAKISKIDKRTLAITEIPYTTTTESIKDSIIKANDKGKIKIRKVDDNTADKVEIVIQVSPDESSDKTIDALYAFTDCEVSIAPNSCVIWDEKPHFLGVSEILRRSAEHTKSLLGLELKIRLGELSEAWHAASLERIFIENRLYQLIEGCKSREEAYSAVDKGLEPFKMRLRREVTLEDVQKLTELKFIRISRYDSEKADNEIRQIEEDLKSTQYDLDHLTEYTVAYYERIRDKYGKGRHKILTLVNSFHGRTLCTLSATGQDVFHNYFFPFTEGFDYAVANDIKSVRAKADDMTCAIMMELIQGEGGVLPLDREFVKEVEKLCREKDMLLIIDEVQTGIGRTGSLFAFQQYDIKPDVVTMAKGLGGGMPIGAVMAADTCCNVLTPGTHATTFGGTPIVCSAANVVLDTVGDGQFLMKVREKGEYLRNGILSLGSPNIKGVRGMGLMLGIIVEEGKHSVFANKLIENGVLAITAGKNAVRLLPPLTISKKEMDEALAIMAKVF